MGVDLLVTGGDGLLGSSLKPLCPDAVYLTRRDGDLTDPHRVTALFERFRPARVLHLAARVGGVRANAVQNAELFAENVQINTNVLMAAQRAGVSRLVSVISTCAFALYSDRPSTEEDLHVGLPYEGNLGYGCAKRMLDIHTRLLWKQYGSRFSTLAPVTMYGPHDCFDTEDGHVIGSLICKAIQAKETAGALEVWGGGQAIRQFVFAPDVARLLLAELDSFQDPGTTLIAPDAGVTIELLARLIADAVGAGGAVTFDRTKPEGVAVKRLQSSHFGQRFPQFIFTSLADGLRKTFDWALLHPEAVRRSEPVIQ